MFNCWMPVQSPEPHTLPSLALSMSKIIAFILFVLGGKSLSLLSVTRTFISNFAAR